MKKLVSLCGLGLLAVTSTGCSVRTDDLTEQSPAAEETVMQTIVVVKDDGATQVFSKPVTLAELTKQLLEREARVAARDGIGDAPNGLAQSQAAISVTANCESPSGSGNLCGCDGADLWVWDKTTRNRSMVCFYGSGSVNLTTLPHYVPLILCQNGNCYYAGPYQSGYWSTNIKSIWGGTDYGTFGNCADFIAGANITDFNPGNTTFNMLTLGWHAGCVR